VTRSDYLLIPVVRRTELDDLLLARPYNNISQGFVADHVRYTGHNWYAETSLHRQARALRRVQK
jgi:hypothetical protein